MLYADGRYGNQVEPTDHNSQIPTTGTKAFKNVIAVVNLLVEIGPIGLPGIFQRGVYITCNWWVQLWALVAKYPKMPPPIKRNSQRHYFIHLHLQKWSALSRL